VALILSVNPNLKHDEVRKILFETAVDLGDPGKDVRYGHGRVNAAAAVEAAEKTLPPGAKEAKGKRGRKRGRKDPGNKLMEMAKLWEMGQNFPCAIDTYKQVVQLGERTKHNEDAVSRIKELLEDPEIKAAYDKELMKKAIEDDLSQARSDMLEERYEEVVKICTELKEKAEGRQLLEVKKLLREAKNKIWEKEKGGK
jgi:hypothetical protein